MVAYHFHSIMSDTTFASFILLAAAICAVWARPVMVGRTAVPPWLALFVGAGALGLAAGLLRAPAVTALAVTGGAAYLTANASRQSVRVIFGVVTALLAIALAMHKLPGFNNPVVIEALTLSDDAAPFTQYANFDKGAVGLILLALLCGSERARTWSEFGVVMRRSVPVLLITLVAVLGLATAIGAVRPDVKLSPLTLQFIAVNLFFTVVAEEAFFRGFLQHRMAESMARWPAGAWIAIAVSGLLFGAVHLAGGLPYALLATVAGVGYAYSYHLTRRIEAPIVLHVVLNAVHFIGFTYPALK